MEFIILILLILFLVFKLSSILGSENELKFFSTDENLNINNLIVQQNKYEDIFLNFEYLTQKEKQFFDFMNKENSNITPLSFLNIAKDVMLIVFENYSINNYDNLKNFLNEDLVDLLTLDESHKNEKIEILSLTNAKIIFAEKINFDIFKIKIQIKIKQLISNDQQSPYEENTVEIWSFQTLSLDKPWKVTEIQKIED